MAAGDSASDAQFSLLDPRKTAHLEGGLPFRDLHPSMSGSKVPLNLSGPVLGHVYERAGITSWDTKNPPTGRRTEQQPVETRTAGMPPADLPLNSAQGALRAEQLQNFANNGVPTHNEFGEKVDPKYLTDTYPSGESESWIMDGHHRIVTSRLKAKEQ